ncbi:hypothetical protein [Hymenobacter terricola]|uniref:hypothetical protein n=1 Tax=Hymenobacter terricola TaxID=2819236 RepID=UPI001B30D40D|nr:hypothetical protein [Hymenobacter terricola]
MKIIRLATLAIVLGSCQNAMTLEGASNHDVIGTYLYSSPDFNNAVGKALNQHLTLTADKATLSHGSYSTDFEYEVKNGYVFLISGNTRVGYRIVSHDTLYDDGLNGFGAGNYVRVSEQ